MRRILRFHTPFELAETTVFDGGLWKFFATDEHLPNGLVPAEVRACVRTLFLLFSGCERASTRFLLIVRDG